MMLIISACNEKLSEPEFVEPLKKLVGDSKVMSYKSVQEKDVLAADKIIISGTALKDFDYLDYDFSWLRKTNKSVLGICAGMQIIAKVFGAELIDCKNIGVKKVTMLQKNKLADNDFNAYFLHTKIISGGEFDILSTVDGHPAIVKHKQKQIYGCIFHPEVMNEDMIFSFVNLR